MTAEIIFNDGNWSSKPLIVTPEAETIQANERYTVVEYTVKVSVLRVYYENEERIKEK